MNEITTEFFSATTAYDEANYFWGEYYVPLRAYEGPSPQLTGGTYRIIDGKLCQIQSGLTPDEIRHRLDLITKK